MLISGGITGGLVLLSVLLSASCGKAGCRTGPSPSPATAQNPAAPPPPPANAPPPPPKTDLPAPPDLSQLPQPPAKPPFEKGRQEH